MYKLISSAGDTDDFSIGFYHSRDRRQRELTNHKTQKGKYHVEKNLEDTFGFAEHQRKGNFSLG